MGPLSLPNFYSMLDEKALAEINSPYACPPEAALKPVLEIFEARDKNLPHGPG
jgi:hypothetical protein